MLEFNLTHNEGLEINLEDLKKTEAIRIHVHPTDLHKAYHLIQEVKPYCQDDISIHVSCPQSMQRGAFLGFSVKLEALGIATLDVLHTPQKTDIHLCKLGSALFESRSVVFKSGPSDIKLTYTSSFDILRRFPLHMQAFYEQDLLDYIVEHAEDGAILDIGANIGNHSIFLGLNTNSPIYAFEPRPDTFAVLQKNVRQNALEDQIQCFQLALGDHTGTLDIESTVDDNSGATRFRDASNGNIPVQTLDRFLETRTEQISVMKIDVEGMEIQVLNGAKETLTHHKPILFAEALDEHSALDLKNKMSEMNYHYVQSHCLTPMLEFRPNSALRRKT